MGACRGQCRRFGAFKDGRFGNALCRYIYVQTGPVSLLRDGKRTQRLEESIRAAAAILDREINWTVAEGLEDLP